MRRLGNSKRELMSALRTRSLLSRTVASGKPTIANFGSPPVMWTSTCTGGASIPTLARLTTVASDIAGSRLVEEMGASMSADRVPRAGGERPAPCRRRAYAFSSAGPASRACAIRDRRPGCFPRTRLMMRVTPEAPPKIRAIHKGVPARIRQAGTVEGPERMDGSSGADIRLPGSLAATPRESNTVSLSAKSRRLMRSHDDPIALHHIGAVEGAGVEMPRMDGGSDEVRRLAVADALETHDAGPGQARGIGGKVQIERVVRLARGHQHHMVAGPRTARGRCRCRPAPPGCRRRRAASVR